MKYEKIVIETDGTFAGTKVTLDNKPIEYLSHLEFSTDANEVFARINMQVARRFNGIVKSKKVKVRDKNEKFIEKTEVETEPLILERKV
jgi:hypothetical protein